MVKALSYLHSKGIIHRDIKPENVLLDKNFNAKLCDFGLSCQVRENEVRTSICGTEEYMSPEVFMSKGHSQKADVWCLGILLYEMLMGMPPFQGEGLYQKIISRKIMIKKDFKKDTRDLLKGMLQRQESKRFDI